MNLTSYLDKIKEKTWTYKQIGFLVPDIERLCKIIEIQSNALKTILAECPSYEECGAYQCDISWKAQAEVERLVEGV